MSILVVGSFVMDMVTSTDKVPAPGETVIGKNFNMYPGGKGINQAIAAARLESKVYMSGVLGKDQNGTTFKHLMTEEAIDFKYVFESDNHTGIGNIIINEKNAQNQIVVIPGANHDYEPVFLSRFDHIIKDVNIVVAQLELPIAVIKKLAHFCKMYQKKFILNPAPAQHLDDDILDAVTYLTPNETELSILVNRPIVNEKDVYLAAYELMNKGIENVIVTLGDKGSIWFTKDQTHKHPGFRVKAIDTVAAGDSFNGALAYGIDQGLSIQDTLDLCNAVGALTVQKKGAIPSLPTKEDVIEFLKRKK